MVKPILFAMAMALSLHTPATFGAVRLLDFHPNTHWQDGLLNRATTVANTAVEKKRAAGELGCKRYCDELEPIFARIVEVARAQTPEAALTDWTLVITRTPDEDAWTLPDGHVFISEDFIARERLAPAEIAFVLGHEVSHVLYRDQADTLDLAKSVVPMGVNASVEDIYATMDFDIGLLLSLAPFMSEQELEADRTGLLLAAMAGYDPAVGIGYVARLSALPPEHSIVATHPDGQLRLSSLQTTLPVAARIYERNVILRAGFLDE